MVKLKFQLIVCVIITEKFTDLKPSHAYYYSISEIKDVQMHNWFFVSINFASKWTSTLFLQNTLTTYCLYYFQQLLLYTINLLLKLYTKFSPLGTISEPIKEKQSNG
jgi:hypothetical protein